MKIVSPVGISHVSTSRAPGQEKQTLRDDHLKLMSETKVTRSLILMVKETLLHRNLSIMVGMMIVITNEVWPAHHRSSNLMPSCPRLAHRPHCGDHLLLVVAAAHRSWASSTNGTPQCTSLKSRRLDLH